MCLRKRDEKKIGTLQTSIKHAVVDNYKYLSLILNRNKKVFVKADATYGKQYFSNLKMY